ncbi:MULTISPECIES: N-acetyltransferase [Legionella]|uniref:N-acetyltransferase domain-containing protein n=1 Tax=Legionella resiliens TaxID=2905958 RepID=A0ABS8X3D2_9GAMM|nr:MULTISPECIES: N-acetyltransferase [unclassified Legionella]MCE0723339.1 hypothetical protein [Legionella sp. 9fVS26]MCE3532492.1 hypothetical protein [Legionella sp. 8cVS16]QLZ68633.1 hypothetical protein FOLKNPGA_01412 [Legionella sp. PC1000]
MSIDVVLCEKSKHFNDFLHVPFQLHKYNENWVPPLHHTTKRILDKKNPFYKEAEINHWVAYHRNKAVGRISAIINRLHHKIHDEKIAFWGFFECENSNEVASVLFKHAERWVVGQGMQGMRGPMNPSINYECGLQISAFDTKPYIMMPQNPEYYINLVEQEGYKKIKDLQAWTVGMDEIAFDPKKIQIIKKICDKYHITIRTINMKDFKNEIKLIVKIYNDAWAKNWGYLPLDVEEFYYLASELKSSILPNLIFIAEVDGEPCGFSVGLPDLNQLLIHARNGKLFPFNFLKLLWQFKVKKIINQGRVPLLGVLQKYQHLPIGGLLYYEYFRKINQLNYQQGELSWILEDNHAMQAGLELINATHYKTYRIYEKSLGNVS